MSMELIILGSGTCAPSVRRAGPSACLISDGHKFLIDSASGTLRQLAKISIRPSDIDFLIYTHLHVDHTGEFAPFIFASKYAPDAVADYKVTILAAEGFQNFWQGLTSAWGEWVTMPKADLIEMPTAFPSSIQAPPFIIKTAPVNHIPSSLAFRIENSEGKAIVFSGDTDVSDSLISLAKGADILVIECSFPEGKKKAGHLTPGEAGLMAREAGVKQVVLTHFYPECDEVDIAGPCRKIYKGPVHVAEDFMKLNLIQ